jgi:hypothetical protein
VKPQGHGSMITKVQGVHLVEVGDTPVVKNGLRTNMEMLVSHKFCPRGRHMMARLNRPSHELHTQGVWHRLHGLQGQEKTYQHSDWFSFSTRNGDA